MNDTPPASHPASTPAGAASTPDPARRRFWKLGLAGSGLALLAGGGAWAWQRQFGTPPASQAYLLAPVQRGDIEELVSATGSLQPRDYVDVGAQVSGQIERILVEVGSEVQAGDLLGEIDAETSAARVDASRAQLRAQQAQLAERELALVKAERDWRRQKNLMAEDASTTEALQNAETAVRTAQAQRQSLKAQMEQLQASMRVEEANLKYTRIYAPIAGTVVSITARQGQTINATQNAPTLLRVADLATMTVQTQVSEADVTRLRTGMPVYFTTLGNPGRRWNGQLRKIEPTPTVTNNVVLYNVLFDVPNPNRSLMTQMTAQVFFIAAAARDVLQVPVSALTLVRGAEHRPAGDAAGAAGRSQPVESAAAVAAEPPARSASAPTRSASAPARRQRPPEGAERPQAPAAGRPQGEPGGPDGAAAEGASGRGDRAAFQQLSEEERERLRAQRRAAREAQAAAGEGGGGGGGGAGGGEGRRGPPADAADMGQRPRREASPTDAGERRAPAPAPAPAQAPAPAPAPAAPARAPAPAGAASRPRQPGERQPGERRAAAVAGEEPRRMPRRATVKVVTEQGAVQEREVLVGTSNRVHAEVLSGLQEGERVVVGVRQPEVGRRPANGQQPQAAGARDGQNNPFGPTGTAPAGPGRAR